MPKKRQQSMRCTACGKMFAIRERARRYAIPFTRHAVLWCSHCHQPNGWHTGGRPAHLPALKAYASICLHAFVKEDELTRSGKLQCVTCQKLMSPGDIDVSAGHCMPALQGTVYYYDRRCVHVQCRACNGRGGGRQQEYLLWMLANYGEATVQEIIDAKNRKNTGSVTVGELREVIATYGEWGPV